MNISEVCIRRPVLTTLLMASIVVLGIFGYRLLPVAALPAVDFPTIRISATLPGASPETMAASVASPIERQLSTIAGITSLTSSSSLGNTDITVQFDLGRNIDGASLDVQTALSIAQRRLPIEMTTPPSFRKVNPGDFPVIFFSMRSATMPLSEINDFAETVLSPQLSQLPGVAQVAVYGAQRYAVRVQVDPVAAAARNVSLDEIRTVVSRANSAAPVGNLDGNKQSLTLVATSSMKRAADYADVIVKYVNGAPIKLSEVARVIDSVENDKVATWFNDDRAIVLAIQRQPDANTVEVVDAALNLIPRMRAQIPAAIELTPLFDRSTSIRDAVHDVKETLAIAVVLVILVIFLFLRKISATVIPSLAVPMSLVGTFAAMYMFGFSINNMTLLALTLSVGFVVDDAIVMLENIVRHVEGGMRPYEAALKGSREIGFTIVSITFSLIAVFIPVLLMGGMVGRVFREFAVTVAVAIVVSGFVALTLTPMLCARVLKGHHPGEEEKQNVVLRGFEWAFSRLLGGYEWALDRVIAFKPVMLGVTLLTLVGTIWLYAVAPKGFFPTEDTGFLTGITEAKTDISYSAMVEHQRKLADIVRADPAVAYVNSTVGIGGPNSIVSSGRMLVALKPKKERDELRTVVDRLRRTANAVPGIRIFFQPIQNINLGGRPSKSQYQYTMQSNDTEALYRLAPEMREKISQLPGLLDVTTDLYVTNPQVSVEVDRQKASVYGVTIDQVRQELYNAFGTRQVATIYTPSNDYQVILQALPEVQKMGPDALNNIYLKTASGTSVPLSAVTRFERTVGPLQVNHQGQQPSVTISFNLAQGTSLGQATDAIRRLERDERLPASITATFQGTTQVFEEAQKGQGILILAAIFAAYIVLGILYESFIHPITIISGLPSAGIGAILTLMLFKMDLSVIAMIGIVMLVGIVKKNAIMMIDFALERRRIGLSAEAAIREAALLRFRPIMMTTFAAIFGVLPIALGAGAGAELRQPLGIAVVGGLCVSQFLTLFITPVIYLYLDRFDRMLKRRLEPQLEEVKDAPAQVAAE
ncbi:MAG TPA: efflux RND transporter permease subunit [Pseudolabrys sp.]|nr:efflux RND transporter permease subunit [Pseudolabrys sp.]